MGVRAVLTILLFAATVTADESVSFWRENFTMTCPEAGKWYKNDKEVGLETDEPREFLEQVYNSDTKGLYHCEYGEPKTKYYFYVKGKACKYCFELDAVLFALIIVVDVLGTVLVMMIIYKFTKKKGSGPPAPSSKAPARSGGHGPPVPSVDYEQLNPHTRSQETYSVVNRTG